MGLGEHGKNLSSNHMIRYFRTPRTPRTYSLFDTHALGLTSVVESRPQSDNESEELVVQTYLWR